VWADEHGVLVGEWVLVALGYIWMSTYGAAAAKSQKLSAPCLCSRCAMAHVLEMMPVTFEAAENEPIFSGRSA